MLKWLFSGAERRRRRKEEQEFIDIVLGDSKPKSFCLSSGGGKATTIRVHEAGDKLDLLLQHKLRPTDVQNGRLLPSASWGVRRRGGKLITHLGLTHGTAEELHKVLGEALKDARRKRRKALFQERVTRVVFSFFAIKAQSTA